MSDQPAHPPLDVPADRPAADRPAAADDVELVLAVLTFRRPDDLAEAVPALVAQLTEAAAPAGFASACVLVVDNDPDGGARGQVEAFGPPVRYVHEPTPGIAAARNRALDVAGPAVLVFVDDDERPEPGWLAALLATFTAPGTPAPAAVVGPVVSRYEVEPDPWVRDGRFFDRRRLPTGTSIDVAATNNLLLDLRHPALADLRFDERFGLTGGSDTLYTRTLVRRGGRMVWCDEAVVVDVVPAARVTRTWVLRRAFRSGNSWSRVALALAEGPLEATRERLVCTARGVVRCVGGGARWLVGVLTASRAHRAKGRRSLMRGAGMVAGAWGSVYTEYRR